VKENYYQLLNKDTAQRSQN